MTTDKLIDKAKDYWNCKYFGNFFFHSVYTYLLVHYCINYIVLCVFGCKINCVSMAVIAKVRTEGPKGYSWNTQEIKGICSEGRESTCSVIWLPSSGETSSDWATVLYYLWFVTEIGKGRDFGNGWFCVLIVSQIMLQFWFCLVVSITCCLFPAFWG